jgi:hypothetical protein
MKLLKRPFTLGAIFAAVCYILSYVILMNHSIPAQDDSGRVVYLSSYRWSELQSVDRDGKRINFVGPHPLNTVFYPLDWMISRCGFRGFTRAT